MSPTPGNPFRAIVAAIAAGETPRAAAIRIGIPAALAEEVSAEAQRLGLLASAAGVCGACTPAIAPRCRTCPLAASHADGIPDAAKVSRVTRRSHES